MANDNSSRASHHSAEVSMYLQANGRRIDVAGCLDNRCTLREPTKLEPCDADLVTIIDGEEYRKRVSFAHGISDDSLDVEYAIAS